MSILINDDNWRQYTTAVGFAKGLVPRDFDEHPLGCYASSAAFDLSMDLIPREEWPERCEEMAAKKTRLSDIRDKGDSGRPIKSLDQNGQGYCWAYSTTAAVTLLRAKANMPLRRLSAHAVAARIMGFRNRGGWGALSLDFIAEHGVPTIATWPEKSMSRQHNNDSTWQEAKDYRITEGWIELNINHASDADMDFDQVATCLLNATPVVCDFNWWRHSVCGMDLVDLKPRLGQQGLADPNRWGNRIWNSWRDTWGQNGTSVLQGRRGIPDGACAPRAVVVT